MMPDRQPPNATEVATRQAAAIVANRAEYLEFPIQRAMDDAPFVQRGDLLRGIEVFHRQRMASIPSATKFPESPPWVEHVLQVDRELARLASLSDRELAILRSLDAYLTFRGFATAGRVDPAAEKCRVAYLPDSEVGAIHIKNVDDPATHWRGEYPLPQTMPYSGNLCEDGVGSGLHIDDEPDEIFPLPVRQMCARLIDDVPGAIQFYTRYSPFWGRCNLVLHDRQKRSCAIEKSSYNFFEVFHPDSSGRSHCSGMVCRDPNSPQGQYQRRQRQTYLRRFNQPTDGPDNAFWLACERAERRLADRLQSLDQSNCLASLVELFRAPWPRGLSKEGSRLHPRQTVREYTLVTCYGLIDQRTYVRWVRDPLTLKMPDKPQEFRFESSPSSVPPLDVH